MFAAKQHYIFVAKQTEY